MLDETEAFASAVERLQVELSSTWDFDAMVDLEKSARNLDRQYPGSPRIAAIVGTAIRRRLEWEAASTYFLGKSLEFPEEYDFQYDAALTAIDAGNYQRGQDLIKALGARLNVLTDRQLRGIWRASPLVALPEVAMAAFALAQERGVSHCTTGIEGRLKTALENASSAAVQAIGVVSIGENCLPWQICNRWGLRPKETMLDQESPFNLAQTMTNDVSALLEDGVDRLIACDLLSTSVASDGTSRPLNNTYHFDFNHERGSLFLENEFAALMTRYSGRIGNLKQFLGKKPCVYVHYTERDGDLERLANAITRASAHKDFRIVIFDVWDGRRTSVPASDHVYYHKVALPRPEYQWFQPDHWDADDGLGFERKMHVSILDAVLDLYRH